MFFCQESHRFHCGNATQWPVTGMLLADQHFNKRRVTLLP